jgi:hypothetical protein
MVLYVHANHGNQGDIPRFHGALIGYFHLSPILHLRYAYMVMGSQIVIHKRNTHCSRNNQCMSGLLLSFTVNVPVTIKSCLPIDHSNTTNLLTDNHDIRKHFERFESTLFPSTTAPSPFIWLDLFPIPRTLR